MSRSNKVTTTVSPKSSSLSTPPSKPRDGRSTPPSGRKDQGGAHCFVIAKDVPATNDPKVPATNDPKVHATNDPPKDPRWRKDSRRYRNKKKRANDPATPEKKQEQTVKVLPADVHVDCEKITASLRESNQVLRAAIQEIVKHIQGSSLPAELKLAAIKKICDDTEPARTAQRPKATARSTQAAKPNAVEPGKNQASGSKRQARRQGWNRSAFEFHPLYSDLQAARRSPPETLHPSARDAMMVTYQHFHPFSDGLHFRQQQHFPITQATRSTAESEHPLSIRIRGEMRQASSVEAVTKLIALAETHNNQDLADQGRRKLEKLRRLEE